MGVYDCQKIGQSSQSNGTKYGSMVIITNDERGLSRIVRLIFHCNKEWKYGINNPIQYANFDNFFKACKFYFNKVSARLEIVFTWVTHFEIGHNRRFPLSLITTK